MPSMGTEREEYWNEMMRVLRASYGSVDNATTTLSKDCSIGYGCIPFAKFVAAKHSNLPTPTRLARIAQAGIPAVVFGNRADEPAHPVENGRVVAQALGATFHEASTHEEALAEWPRVIADFVNGIARDEGIVLASGAPDSTTDARAARNRRRRGGAAGLVTRVQTAVQRGSDHDPGARRRVRELQERRERGAAGG